MGILVLFCCIWLLGNICIYSKRKIEEVAGIGFCILILLLQCLAMIRRLAWIGILLIALSFVLLGIHIYRKKVKAVLIEMKNDMFTFGGAVFLVMIAICIFFQYGRRVHSHDEFSFWATAIKTLWNYNGFASAAEMWSTWEYPQGMPLLEWFGSWITGHYAEWTFYAIRLIFDFSLIIPVFKNFRLKFYWCPVAAVLVYLLPGIANTTSYDVLSVDGDLALLFGFLIYSILERKRKDTFYYSRIIILSSTIILMKDFSIVFVIYGWLLLFLLDYLEKKQDGWKKNNIWNAMVLLFPLLTLLSWSWYLRAVGNTSTRVSGRASASLEALLTGTWQGTGHEYDILIAFLKSFFLGRANFCLTANHNEGLLTPFVIVIAVIGVIVVLAGRGYITKAMRNILVLYWLLIVFTYSVLFITAHCTLFVGEIEKYAKFKFMTLSLGRYCAPVYLGGILTCILWVFDLAGQTGTGKVSLTGKRVLVGTAVMILLCTNYSGVQRSIWPLQDDIKKKVDITEKKLEEDFQWTSKLKEGYAKVYFLGSGYSGRSAYLLVPLIAQPPSGYYPIYSIGELQDYLYDNEFNYVYYADEKKYEGLAAIFDQMLPEGEHMEIGGLYKIDMSGVKFRLERVDERG